MLQPDSFVCIAVLFAIFFDFAVLFVVFFHFIIIIIIQVLLRSPVFLELLLILQLQLSRLKSPFSKQPDKNQLQMMRIVLHLVIDVKRNC